MTSVSWFAEAQFLQMNLGTNIHKII